MVSVGVSRMGKTGIVFVEPGAKVNREYYCQHVLGGGPLPDIRARCQRYSWTLQQDGAPSHTARNTLAYLQHENVTFIEPDMWPPNSPDLNPVYYAVWVPFSRWFINVDDGTIHDNQPAKAGDRHWVAAFHWSRYWSVASPAWVRRSAARWTHWTCDVKTAWCELL